jgi:chemotaxis protein MotB
MKTKLNVVLAAGVAVILLSGCVSNRKYKSSQAALSQVRNDSTRLAQQVASLNGNVNALQEKNTALQRSLDSASSSYATQQKSLNYYHDYFNQQQSSMAQVSDQIKGALSQAGLGDQDIQQVNNIIYVRLDENKVFKKNSTAFTTSGKQAVNSLAQVIKSRSDVNVFVSNDDSASGQSTAMGNMSSSGMENTTMKENAADNTTSGNMETHSTPGHRTHHHGMHTQRSMAGHAPADSTKPATAKATPHKRIHRKYPSSEGSSMTYYSNMPKYSGNRAWTLKHGRMNAVAGGFLQNGIAKVNLTMQQPAPGNPQSNNIKVIITPMMSDFNPQSTTER